MPHPTPDRAARARDERLLRLIAWFEAQGIEVRFDENERPSVFERIRAFFARAA